MLTPADLVLIAILLLLVIVGLALSGRQRPAKRRGRRGYDD